MITQELIQYITQQLAQGDTKKKIKSILLSRGWREEDIDSAFQTIPDPSLRTSPLPQASTYLLGPIALLKQSLNLYVHNFRVFFGIQIFADIVLVLITVAVIFMGGSGLLVTGITKPSDLALGPVLFLSFLIFLYLILFTLINLWNSTALLTAVVQHEERIGINEAYRRGWHKIRSYWWVLYLSSFIVASGLILFLVPGIIFMVWFSFVSYIVIAENITGMNVLLKSKEYVKSHWWGVLWRLLFLVLVIGCLQLLLGLIVGFFIKASNILILKSISITIDFLFINCFITPLSLLYFFLLYQNIKVLKKEFIFTPSRKSKILFIFIGIAGLLIISLLFLAIVLKGINPARQFRIVNDTKRQQDQMLLQKALKDFYAVKREYPMNLQQLVPDQISSVPIDPKTATLYEYLYDTQSKDYRLCITFEEVTERCVTSQSETLPKTFPLY